MKFFYISNLPNPEGQFEIHEKECPYIPDAINRDYLGPFNNGKEAMRRGLQLKALAVLCKHCCANGFEAIFSPIKPKDS
jgi:hypothetical protein